MKNATLLGVGQESVAARWFGLLAIAALLPLAVSLKAQTPTVTETIVTTLGGGPQYYNPGHSFGSSNSVYGTLYSQFHTPSGIAYDSFQGYLYVADRDNNAIRLIDHSANPSEIFTFAPDPPYVPANVISQPVGVAVDALSDVFVLNRGNGANGTVVEFDYLGNLIATNMTKLTNASGIALDTIGDIYVTTRNTVFKITPAGVSNVVVTITNAGTSLQGIVVKRSGPNAGWLAVCDSGRNGIYLINPTSGAVTTNAGFNGAGDGTGSRNQGVLNASARFFQPSGLAEAGDGSLIVTDFGNHRVKVATVTGLTTNLYGVASNDWWHGTTSTGGTATNGWSDGAVWEPDGGPGFGNVQARMPFGVAIGADGTVYTTEDYFHILRKVTGANIPVPPPWPPPPPTGPIATAGYGQVFLTWTASAGATNYNIKRSTSSGGETTFASTTGTSYTDMTNLLDGTTYYYVLSALNTGGEGQNSTEVSATPLFSPAPTNLIVVTTNFGLVSLVWSPSAGATSYNLKRAPSHGGPYAPLASTASTSYNDTAVIDGTTYYYVVTAVNAGGENPTNSPEVSARPPLPPVPDPQIGYVDFPPIAFTSVFHPVSPAGLTFNNDVPIVTIGAAGSQTFYTYSNTPAVTNLPDPTSASSSASMDYKNGLYSISGMTVAQILPNVAIKAIGEESGHPNSAVVSALFQFVVANPGIYGDNAALFAVSNITVGAQMYYTTDGSDPTNDGSGTSIGPITSGTSPSLSVTGTNLQFKIRGFRANYQPSSIVTNLFSADSFVANAISFGTPHGEPSSKFMARPGQFYYAPVTLEMLPGFGKMYSLQFNVTVTNGLVNTNTGFPPPAIQNGAGINFFSMLMTLVTPDEGQYFPPADGNWYLPIPSLIPIINGTQTNLVSSAFVNTNNNLLGVGWLYRTGIKYKASDTNGNVFIDFDTTKQDLTAYSIAHDTLFTEANGKIVVGAYSFQIPTNANVGDKYFIQLGSPSATRDGVGAPGAGIYIQPPPTNQAVIVDSPAYTVGDAAPFHWLNAGDFGDTNLDNSDVMQVYQSAILGVDMPPVNSDLYRAMDSCGNLGISNAATGYFTNGGPYLALFPVTNTMTFNNLFITNDIAFGSLGSFLITNFTITNITITPTTNFIVLTTNIVYTISSNLIPIPSSTVTNIVANNVTFNNDNFTNLLDGSDQTINQIAFGDGNLDIADVYVTLRRSLDTSLFWFERYWTNGQLVAVTTPNLAFNTNIPAAFVSKSSGKLAPAFQSDNGSQPPSVSFVAGDAQGSAGHIVQIPITANVFGGYPLRVLGLNLTVYPLDGSPDLTQPVQFTPAAGLGQATAPFSSTKGNDSYAAAWLDSTISGLSGNATIGTLTITLPASATSMSAYAVHFNVASGSPNGLGVFPKQTWTGLVTLSSRTNSTYNDGISDSWRLRWFGTVYNLLSVSNACPSGDGINNWMKYVAGVDPYTANDFPRLNPKTPPASGAAMSIYWPTVSGKQYAILSSATLFPGNWITNAIVTGTGANMEFDDNSTGTVKFYRVLILP